MADTSDVKQPVKCVDCGLLAKRVAIQGGSKALPVYHEVSKDERSAGVDLQPGYFEREVGSGRGSRVDVTLVCLRGMAVLRQDQADEEMKQDRICSAWYRYLSGRTPQEHLADYMWESLVKQQQEFELRLFEKEQTAQANTQLILAESKQLARENKEVAEASSAFNRRVNLWLIVLAALTLLLAGLQVYFASRPQRPIVIIQEPAKSETNSPQ